MPLPLTVSCFSKIQIGFTFLVPAHLGSPGKGPLNGCVCVCMYFQLVPIFFRSPPFWQGKFWVTGHFGPRQIGTETYQYRSDGSEVSGHFSISTEVSKRHFGHKYRTVRPDGSNCPVVWSKMSHPMVRSFSR